MQKFLVFIVPFLFISCATPSQTRVSLDNQRIPAGNIGLVSVSDHLLLGGYLEQLFNTECVRNAKRSMMAPQIEQWLLREIEVLLQNQFNRSVVRIQLESTDREAIGNPTNPKNKALVEIARKNNVANLFFIGITVVSMGAKEQYYGGPVVGTLDLWTEMKWMNCQTNEEIYQKDIKGNGAYGAGAQSTTIRVNTANCEFDPAGVNRRISPQIQYISKEILTDCSARGLQKPK